MLIGLYADPHITKSIRLIEEDYRAAILKAYDTMYKNFEALGVDKVICLGDFFDKSSLAAKDVSLFTEVMKLVSSYRFSTEYLLGNHEIFDSKSHILRLVNLFPNQYCVDSYIAGDELVYIPYSTDISQEDPEDWRGKIVFTHHDIIGSVLAGGALQANYGISPELLKDAKRVFNGHIHIRSSVDNIFNLGSLFTMQFGEMLEGDWSDQPRYYVYNTDKDLLTPFVNMHNIDFITLKPEEYEDYMSVRKQERSKGFKPVVRFLKTSDNQDIKEGSDALYVTYKQVYEDARIELDESQHLDQQHNVNLKSLITDYINNDSKLNKTSKKRVQSKISELLDQN